MVKELFMLTPRDEALQRLWRALPPVTHPAEEVSLSAALGRVLAADVIAPHPLPQFPRATVDGYAVRAADTVGASESLPAYLRVVGEVLMGCPPTVLVGPGEAVLMHTGGVLPPGADAVVMVERTQEARPGEVEVLRAVAPGEGVIPVGEDVQAGELVIPAGRLLRAQELGGLAALGITRVAVRRRPRVALISTGDELVPPEATPGLNQVRDLNSTTIGALVMAQGGIAVPRGIVPDDAEALYQAAVKALADAELLIITAGSSVSVRDMTATVINRLGQPGVLVHGVPLRPGKPTILAVCEGKPVFGLPGNPVSALNSARLFVVPTLRRWLGQPEPWRATVRARLAENAPGAPGREAFVPVRLEARADGLWAIPIFGESNLIFTLVRGEGVINIPLGVTGLPQGAEVEVELLE